MINGGHIAKRGKRGAREGTSISGTALGLPGVKEITGYDQFVLICFSSFLFGFLRRQANKAICTPYGVCSEESDEKNGRTRHERKRLQGGGHAGVTVQAILASGAGVANNSNTPSKQGQKSGASE